MGATVVRRTPPDKASSASTSAKGRHGAKGADAKGAKGGGAKGGGASPYARELGSIASNWVDRWREVLSGKGLGGDLVAALTVAAVALPLNLALAVACDLPPSVGLISGALGGMVAASLGGAPLQVTGPAAALSAMVLALNKDFGVEGVAAATLIIGLMQIGLGFSLAGKLMRLVPESVLAGFTTGVGLKLLDNQIPELLGFDYKVFELAQMMHRPAWLHQVSWLAVVSGLGVAMLVIATSHWKRFPAALVGISLVTALAIYLSWGVERVGAVPSALPPPRLPLVPDERWLDLALRTLPLGLLAAAESLLSARQLDRMTPEMKPHDPNLELLGQGAANLVVGVFSGMPVTGVVVRSSVNVQSGGRTRLSALLHGAALLVAMLSFSGLIAQIPLAALAGLLCVIGGRLLEFGTLLHLAREDRLEAVAFALAAAGTVSGHLVLGLGAGLLLHAAGRFARRGRAAQEQQIKVEREQGVRAVLAGDRAAARRPGAYEALPEAGAWLANIRERAQVARTAFVHGHATVIGRVVLGEHVHIAAGSSVRADEGSPFFIGSNSNIQDGVVIHALKNKRVRVGGEEWAVYVGRNVSIAHDALVHGPCYIGDDTFVGFKAVVHDSVVGSHCYVGIGAVVVGVEVPDGRFVPHGTIVDSADAVAALPPVTEAHREFNEDVVDVNRGLAVAYHQHQRGRGGPPAGAAPAPRRPAAAWEQDWGAPSDPGRF